MKLRFPDFLTTAHYGGKFVILTHGPHLPPGHSPGIPFCYRLSRPQGHSAIRRIYVNENSMTLSGIEPTTFRFVAQYLNHCATAVPTGAVARIMTVGLPILIWAFFLAMVWGTRS
jgi:hypothetical protein